MAGRKRHELPVDLARAAARFAQWRQGRVFGERIPEPLWDLAVGLVLQYGVSRTAAALRVGYYSLKKRSAEKRPSPNLDGEDRAPSAAFVEWAPPSLGSASECVIELEKRSGDKLRVHFKGQGLPDLAALGRGFWEAR